MKTAISIDKCLFDTAENYSHAKGLSRSKLYCDALSEYMQNHDADTVTEKLNNYYDKYESKIDDDLKAASHRLFSEEDW